MNKNNQDNISLVNKITWYDIDENGYIKGYLKKQAVVYIFKRISNKARYYVGSSINISSRLSTHRSRVISWSNGNYNNASPIFYNSVLKYGWKEFKFGVLEYIDVSIIDINKIKNIILDKEQYYLNKINPSLNVCKIANSSLGIKRNNMFSINLSKARRGKNYKPGLINNNVSNIATPETRLKQSARYGGIKVKIYKSNNLIKEFPTIASTAKFLGVSNRTINKILNTGISYDDYTYKFEVVIGYSIIVVNKENDSVKEYNSISAAANDLAVRRESVSKHININKLLKGIYLISRKLI